MWRRSCSAKGRMRQLWLLGVGLWRKKPCRWLGTISFAAFLGIAAGKTVLGISGSVSVVDGDSMEPTYHSEARVLTTSISTPPLRGDIVTLDDGRKQYALKRVIGLPGETITIWRGYVFINKCMLREPYLAKHTYTFPDDAVGTFVFVLGPEQYFVMGDNRTESVDSRTYGPVERPKLKNRVPLPDSFERPSFLPYTLPAPGKRSIQEL